MNTEIHTRIQNQTPQQQSNLQDFEQGFNQMPPAMEYQTSIPSQGSLTNINSNIPPPLPGTDNQANNLILSSLEQQYFSDFLESFLGDTDADPNFMNNDSLQNPPPFDNINNEFSMKDPFFQLPDPNLYYSVVNNITVPSNNTNPTNNNIPNSNIISSNEQPSSQPLNIINSVNQNSSQNPNNIIDVSKNNTTSNSTFLNTTNSTINMKVQLSSLNSDPNKINKSFDTLDPSKFSLFSDKQTNSPINNINNINNQIKSTSNIPINSQNINKESNDNEIQVGTNIAPPVSTTTIDTIATTVNINNNPNNNDSNNNNNSNNNNVNNINNTSNTDNNNKNNASNQPTKGRRGRPRLSANKKNDTNNNKPIDDSNQAPKAGGSKYKRKRKITAMLTPSQQSKLETLNSIYNINTIGKNKRNPNKNKDKENEKSNKAENETIENTQLSSNASSNTVLNDGNSIESDVNIKEEKDAKKNDAKKQKKGERKQTKELLTEEEKRANHIASEKKRRNLIRLGFQELTDLVPGLKLSAGVGLDGSLMPFNNSKSTILFKAVEYIKQLEARNKELTQQLDTLQRKICIDERLYSVAAVNAVTAARQQSPVSTQNPSGATGQMQSQVTSNSNIPNIYQINNQPPSTSSNPPPNSNSIPGINTNFNQYMNSYNSNSNNMLHPSQAPPPPSRSTSDPSSIYKIQKFNI
jgi:hypothetical protein